MAPELSVVIAVNNEEKNIRILYARLKAALDAIDRKYEIIFVEDGSEDNSYRELCALCFSDRCVKVVKLRKNFGQILGLLAGMHFAPSGIIITMDGDLQHDPADIGRLLEKIDLGYDLVNGKKVKRADSLWARTWPSMIAKRLICWLFRSEYYDINSSFRAYRYTLMPDVRRRGEAVRFLPLMARARGIRFCEVEINCERRKHGKTHYGFAGRLRRLSRDISLLLSLSQDRDTGVNADEFVEEMKDTMGLNEGMSRGIEWYSKHGS